ncbi:MAG: T9SS C-terminal target domain-containing protein, partial [Bacteroidetes bacterium]
GAACGGSSGLYRYTISTNGGLSWSVGAGTNTPGNPPAAGCYGRGPLNPALSQPGRYPNLLLSNPSNNGLTSGLTVVYTGAVLTPSGAGWDGIVAGTAKNVATATPVVTQEVYPYSGGSQYFSYSLVERIPGEYYALSWGWDGTNILESINVNKGVYNPTTEQITWTTTVLNPNYDLSIDGTATFSDFAIAFSPNGNTGYIALLADLAGGGAAGTVSVSFSETKDGGASWSAFTEFNPNAFPEMADSLQSQFSDIDTITGDTIPFGAGIATTGFDLDLVVDKLGNPHAIAVVGNAGASNGDGTYSDPAYSIFSGAELFVYDFTKDSFGDWNMLFLDRQDLFRGTFGDPAVTGGGSFTQDPLVQASRSGDGSVVFFSWTDSDTALTTTNNQPNLKGKAFDVDAYTTTDVVNFTEDDANWAGAAIIPRVAPVSLFDGTCTYTVPTTIMDFQGTNGIQPIDIWYFTDIVYDRCTDFVQPAVFFYNCQQTPFANTFTKTNPNCGVADGAISITAAGGVGPYTYLWSANAGSATTASVSALNTGTYTCTVTDSKGCTEVIEVVLNNANAPALGIASQSNISCNGEVDGAATVTTTGGTGPFTFSWSNGENGATADSLAPGVATCTVTDASGCISTVTVTITEPPVLDVAATAVNVSCAGSADGTASAVPSGGSGAISFLWSNGATTATATGLAGGTYTVTITDANGCTATETVAVAEPAAAVITLTPSENTNAAAPYNGLIFASVIGGTAPYTWLWTAPDSTTSTTPNLLSNLCGGTYYLQITDAKGCVFKDSTVVGVLGSGVNCIKINDGVNPLSIGISEIDIFPNPSQGAFTLNIALTSVNDVNVEILNLRGQTLSGTTQRGVSAFNKVFDLSNQSKGIYLLKITTSEGSVTRKIVID